MSPKQIVIAIQLKYTRNLECIGLNRKIYAPNRIARAIVECRYYFPINFEVGLDHLMNEACKILLFECYLFKFITGYREKSVHHQTDNEG